MNDEPNDWIAWLALALLCACAALSALLELMFLGQFYVGTVIVPLVVVGALAANVLIPLAGFRLMHRALGAVLPVACWLIVILALTMYNRPEGDLFVIGEYGQQYAFYGLLLVGAVAGFATIVVVSGGPIARRPPVPAKQPPRKNGTRVSR